MTHVPANAVEWITLLVEAGILLSIVRGLMILGEMRLKINTMWTWWIEFKSHTEAKQPQS